MNKVEAYLVVGLVLSLAINYYFLTARKKAIVEIANLKQNWALKHEYIKNEYKNELSGKSMDDLLAALSNPNMPKIPGE